MTQPQRKDSIPDSGIQAPADPWPAILAHLWRGGAWGYYWTLPAQLTYWRPTANPGPAPSEGNVYFGVHPTAEIPERWQDGRRKAPETIRATITDVSAINCVFADFDPDKGFADKAATLAHVDGLPVTPSVVIDSGGGYHCYWLLASPFIFAEQADRERARLLQAAWVSYVGSDGAAKDLARILRPAGTLNSKYDPPRPVAILRADLGRVYTIGSLETACKPPEARPTTTARGNGNGRGPSEDTGQFWLDKAVARYVPHGGELSRNETGFWLACQLRDSGMAEAEARGWLLAYARTVSSHGDPYGDGEAMASLKSAYGRAKREEPKSQAARATPQRSAPAAPPQPQPTEEAEPPAWLDGEEAEPTAEPQPTEEAEPPAWLDGEEAEPTAEPQPSEESPALPQVICAGRPMPAITTEAIDALARANNPPALFVRSGALARVRTDERGRPVIDDVDAAILRGRMARAAFWYKTNQSGTLRHVPPPDDIVKDALALGSWPFPALEAITETPACRVDGSIFDRPGYDATTGLYYVPAAGMKPPTVPSNPTRAELAAAVALLDECIGDFPYCDEASRANAFALLLTPILRPAIIGNTPLALIDKPQAGTGASLLAEAVSILATGRQAAMMTAPRDDEEWRKKITAALLEGATVITIDNVENVLQSASLAAALTTGTWKDRLLGQSATAIIPQRATWLATGNNLKLGGDMPRRCYWIRLDAQTARPWRRQDFRHPGLIGWVTDNRGALLGALLTVARAWYAAGQPMVDGQPSLGSFDDWARTMGGVLAHAGIAGFLGNLDALYERVDEEGQAWLRFFATWYDVIGEAEISGAELMARLKRGLAEPGKDAGGELLPQDPGDVSLVEALPEPMAEVLTDPKRGANFSRIMGKALAKRTDVTFDDEGLRLEKRQDTDKKTAKWRLTRGRKGAK